MKAIILSLLFVSALYPSIILTKYELSQLKIDHGIANCWKRGIKKYVVIIDIYDKTYAVNGSAKSKAKITPRIGWKNKNLLLKLDGDPAVFSQIITKTLKSGCSQYYGY